MRKNTLEKIENDYREAIRNKFRIEKTEGKHSHYLSNPSQALLRDLCWEIFSSNPKDEDLSVYRNFFRTDFKSEEDTSTKYTDKFKKVGGFYRGEKNPANITTVDLAAILVDFQPRPFNKFRKEIDPEDLKLIEELRDTNFPKNDFFSDNLTDEVEIEKVADLKSEEQEQIQSQESELIQNQKLESVPMPIVSVTSVVKEDKEKPENIIPTKLLHIGIVTFVVFGLVAAVIYFAFFNKQCMQWSEDHYEIVDCSSKIEGNFNEIIRLDKDLLDFRKIKACDTTTCFLTNGDPIVWYGKTANGIDFFNDNGNGLHPENKKALHPMTGYMFSKYLKGKICE
ncbi:hypothetical protein [Flavobacterium ginsenosidimutans]|uniref:hypothetical protein n=1 Tax=Flavobacterium ginsenosidimutans TaxID=687844 RepID=UPI000DAEA086|nr:hypothetical protein [Flavobacterium ginsenosidimutans]KAF2328768.1 hypothetical protein DM444_17015 [Flavobacterium ginsenosidimutans]